MKLNLENYNSNGAVDFSRNLSTHTFNKKNPVMLAPVYSISDDPSASNERHSKMIARMIAVIAVYFKIFSQDSSNISID